MINVFNVNLLILPESKYDLRAVLAIPGVFVRIVLYTSRNHYIDKQPKTLCKWTNRSGSALFTDIQRKLKIKITKCKPNIMYY